MSTEEKLQAIGQLATGIAHEVNIPAQYIRDNLYFLQDTFRGICRLIEALKTCAILGEKRSAPDQTLEGFRDLLDEIDFDFAREQIPQAIDQSLMGINQVVNTVQAIKEFAHPHQPSNQLIQINDAIRNAVLMSKCRWKEAGEIHLELAESLPPVQGSSDALVQVMLNLLVNAADAVLDHNHSAPQNQPPISVRTGTKENQVQIEVCDLGGGIPDDVVEHIFDPFFTTKDVGKGSGQGLTICRKQIEKLGGTLDFRTVLGQGTTFVIQLPAAQ